MPYDFRIGITGHRNLAAGKVSAIEEAVRKTLDRIDYVFVESSARPHAYAWINP